MVFKVAYITKFFLGKKSVVLTSFLLSLSLGGILNQVSTRVSTKDLEGSILVLVILVGLTVFFSIIDMITGVLARPKGSNISSGKWGNTVGKLVSLVLYLSFSLFLMIILSDNYFVLVVLFSPLVLNILKEYISIGENLEKLNGKKPYLFSVVDKIFLMLENKFFTHVTEKINKLE
tara:strand:- start:11592 stop:12119 length:528 start_codon:yes stop_codon:yes gene_type:complete